MKPIRKHIAKFLIGIVAVSILTMGISIVHPPLAGYYRWQACDILDGRLAFLLFTDGQVFKIYLSFERDPARETRTRLGTYERISSRTLRATFRGSTGQGESVSADLGLTGIVWSESILPDADLSSAAENRAVRTCKRVIAPSRLRRLAKVE